MKVIGQPVKRVEDPHLLRGRGRYTADVKWENMLHAKILRSPYAHAKIKRIDTSKAEKLPGVHAILTGPDAEKILKPTYNPLEEIHEPRYALAVDRVYYVGQDVVAVAADSEAIAEDALELVQVEYEPLPVVVDPEVAARDDSSIAREDVTGIKHNEFFEYKLEAGQVNEAFKNADHVVEGRFTFGRQHMAPLEPSAVVALYDAVRDSFVFQTAHQMPFLLRHSIASAFGIPETRIRVVVEDMGGGFGAKTAFYSYYLIAGHLSKLTNRPVKIVLDRREELIATGARNGCVEYVSVALNNEGKILGIKGKFIWDGGHAGFAAGTLVKGLLNMVGPYKIENVSFEGHCVYTNKSMTEASRGFGAPQTVLPRERLLDVAAKKLGIDPVELRLKNMYTASETPYKTAVGYTLDSPYYGDCLKAVAEAIHWQEISKKKEPYTGVGFAIFQKNNSGYQTHGYGAKYLADYDTVRVSVEPDGSVGVYTGALPHGQGHQTFLSQISSDELGVPMEKINVFYGDTDKVPYGLGTYASRTTVVSGGACHLACERLVEKMKKIAAYQFEAREEDVSFKDGTFSVEGLPQFSLTFEDIVKIAYDNPSRLPPGLDPGLIATATYDPPGKIPFDRQGRGQFASSFDLGAYAVVVKVDPETGDVKIIDHALAYDSGRLVNPLIVKGQHHGSLAHGIGMSLYEDMVWDEEGEPLNSTFMDYLATTSLDIPNVEKIISFESHPINIKWGYRGAGEGSTIPVPAAIANAVSDACGLDMNDIPVIPEKIWNGLKRRGSSP